MKSLTTSSLNHHSRLARLAKQRRACGGNLFLFAVIALLFTSYIFINISNMASQLISEAKTKSANQQMELQKNEILKALQVSLYQTYWSTIITPPPPGQPPTFGVGQAAAAIQGVTQLADILPNVIPQSVGPPPNGGTGIDFNLIQPTGFVGGNMNVNIQLILDLAVSVNNLVAFKPVVLTGVGTPPLTLISQTPYQNSGTTIGTGTYLDDLFSSTIQVPVNITLTFGTQTISQDYLLMLCRIPEKQFALLAESDFIPANTASVSGINGAARVRGTVGATTTGVNVTDSLVYDGVQNVANAMTQNGGSISDPGGGNGNLNASDGGTAADFRYITETKNFNTTGQQTLRSSSMQGVVDPVNIIPPSYMCREGMGNLGAYNQVNGGPLSTPQQQLFLQAQPFYNTPSANRYLLSYNAGALTVVTPNPNPDGYYAGPLPGWINPKGTSNGMPVIEVAPPLSSNSINLFVGVFTQGKTAPNYDFPNYIVELKAGSQGRLETFPGSKIQPSSFTIVTPNNLVFESGFNYDPSTSPSVYTPSPATYIANSVSFGLNNGGDSVNFSGSYRGKDSGNISRFMQGLAQDGSSGGVANTQINLQNSNVAGLGYGTFSPTYGIGNFSPAEMVYISTVAQQN